MNKNKVWMLRCSKVDINKLAKDAGISETTAAVLVNRDISDIDKVKRFMRASMEDMHDPLLMKDMDRGTDIVKESIDQNKKIAIYGDYDADGVTSTVILYKALRRCGADVMYYIPDREAEGYGMSSERVKKLSEEGIEVILTCDNGISAIDQINLAKELGMIVVLTDHHELPFLEKDEGDREYIVPEADAVINPKQLDCTYPFKMLCGAGLAYKFATVLYNKFSIDIRETYEFIQYAGIGTICDIVDLVDENRIIAKAALNMLSDTNNVGIRALKEVIGIGNRKISSYTVGFQIGPCINATGRLYTADLAVELLLCDDINKALTMAQTLCELNKKRQEITSSSVERIIENIENSSLKNDKVLVIYDKDIHESVAGIVAGRIKDKFNVPTIVITDGNEMPKGSGRSIEKYNLFEELMRCKEYLFKFGGHPMAAGISLYKENIPLLREKLNKNCILRDTDMIPRIRIDRRLRLSDITMQLIKEFELLEPFGKGNSSPLFGEKNLLVEDVKFIGKDGDTLKLVCSKDGTNRIEAVGFKRAEEFKEKYESQFNVKIESIFTKIKNVKMDLIFYPFINNFKGFQSIQVKIIDFRFSSKQ